MNSIVRSAGGIGSFQIDAYFGVWRCLAPLQAADPVTNSVVSLTTDTLKVQARQTFFILAPTSSDAALHIVRSIAAQESRARKTVH